MSRFWNFRHESPNGFKLNRAWHLRQFMVTMVTPACILCLCHIAYKLDGSLGKKRKIQLIEKQVEIKQNDENVEVEKKK